MNLRRHIATLAILFPAILLPAIPGSDEWLVFQRQAILDGEIWRMFTGHWIHWSFSHLIWNCALLAIAAGLIERQSRKLLSVTVAGSVLLIGPTLLLLEAELASYAGLSGIAAGCVASLVTSNICNHRGPVWIWTAVGLLLLVKIAIELINPTPWLATSSGTSFQSVPLAHLIGALAGIGSAVCCRREVLRSLRLSQIIADTRRAFAE